MDTDISHAVEERLAAIEARLDAIEGPSEPKAEEGESEEGEPPQEEVAATSRRGRRTKEVPEAETIDWTGGST